MLYALIGLGIVAAVIGYLQYKHNTKLLAVEAKVESIIKTIEAKIKSTL